MRLSGIVTVSAAVQRMHQEIIHGQTLYSDCQHKREHLHTSLSTEIPQVIIFPVFPLLQLSLQQVA